LVVDLTRYLPGAFASRELLRLGARVVRVEQPGGDPMRQTAPAWHDELNAGKESVVCDLPDDVAFAQALLARADVVLESFRPGVAARLGVGPDDAPASCVYCSITGFGSARAPAARAGYDFVVQAESGLMSITGEPDGEPAKVGVALVDVLAGLNAAVGILAAVERRHATGEGAHVEASLLDSALSALVNQAQSALVTGRAPARLGNAHPSIVPYETFHARDAIVAIAAANDGQFERLCEVLGRAELAADGRFATNRARVENRDSLVPLLAERVAVREAGDLLEALDRAGVPSGKIRNVPEALAAAAKAGDPATLTVEHSTLGALELVRSAVRIDGGSTAPPLPPPLLGEHTRDVLRELGKSDAEVDELLASGVVQALAEA
jgi:CoA:oxalate CoA-transferase